VLRDICVVPGKQAKALAEVETAREFGYLFNAEGGGEIARALGARLFGAFALILEPILNATPAGNANDGGLPTAAGSTALYPRGPGASLGPVPDGYTMVSRWVSPQEAAMWMENQGTAIPAGVGVDRAYVTPPGAEQLGGRDPSRIDFAIPDAALSPLLATCSGDLSCSRFKVRYYIMKQLQSRTGQRFPGDYMSHISVTNEYGIIVRRAALAERGVSWEDLLKVFSVKEPLDADSYLILFGPHFGQEALDALLERLSSIGLKYFDDFFEFYGDYPEWCVFKASTE
jgi:hypothetical protein